MLSAHQVTVTIRGSTLLDAVDVDVRPGEVLGILGPNGAGKSTLLRCLSGAWKPSKGEVSLGGVPLRSVPARALAQRRAVVTQHTDLRFPFSAAEVVALGRAPHRRGHTDSIVMASLKQVEADHLSHRRWPSLSGGERQRIQLARAIAQLSQPGPAGTRYLLLDEPTSSLDLRHQHATLAIARSVAAEGGAVAVILHDLNLAAAYTDRLLLLQGGRTFAAGDTTTVLTAGTIQSVFGLPVQILNHPAGGSLIAAIPAQNPRSNQ